MSQREDFLRAFLRSPSSIGSVAPSSQGLADRMVTSAAINPGDVVVELGAGTGPVTRRLVEMHPNERLIVLEPDAALAAHCRALAPSAEVLEAFAQALPALLAARGLARCDRIVSSLPFAAWSEEVQQAVFSGILGALSPAGRLVTFTYVQSPLFPAGQRARRRLEASFRSVTTSPVVWMNLPPAFVYICDGPRGAP